MKIPDLFIELYMVKEPNAQCYADDLAWAWQVFVAETGVQPPDDWLRYFVLEHGITLEQPARGKSWRGWVVKGLGLNRAMVARHSNYRLERMGLSK